MRSNLPVTGAQYLLRETENLVSRTDLRGYITFVNSDFVRVSGFSEEELLGAPHNIVRHPDMPAVAFADLWRAIRHDRTWTGMLKNRRKNGDYYWVEASAAPLLKDGKVVGYTAMLAMPAPERVARAEQAYRAILDGNTRLSIRDGVVVKQGVFSRFITAL
jgi:aerotaxis receptor